MSKGNCFLKRENLIENNFENLNKIKEEYCKYILFLSL